MNLQSYSLTINDAACDVSIEWSTEAQAVNMPPAAQASASRTVQAVYGSPHIAQPAQATWVTARRVAHLPFH